MAPTTEASNDFLYEQVEQLIGSMIGDGVLRPGERAPSLQFALVLTLLGTIVFGIFPSLIAEIGDAAKTFASSSF